MKFIEHMKTILERIQNFFKPGVFKPVQNPTTPAVPTTLTVSTTPINTTVLPTVPVTSTPNVNAYGFKLQSGYDSNLIYTSSYMASKAAEDYLNSYFDNGYYHYCIYNGGNYYAYFDMVIYNETTPQVTVDPTINDVVTPKPTLPATTPNPLITTTPKPVITTTPKPVITTTPKPVVPTTPKVVVTTTIFKK